jgi:hypothetical protein
MADAMCCRACRSELVDRATLATTRCNRARAAWCKYSAFERPMISRKYCTSVNYGPLDMVEWLSTMQFTLLTWKME